MSTTIGSPSDDMSQAVMHVEQQEQDAQYVAAMTALQDARNVQQQAAQHVVDMAALLQAPLPQNDQQEQDWE